MLDTEFYSVVEDAAGRVRGQLHRLSHDGSWTPPLPVGVKPPVELAMRSVAGMFAGRSRVDPPERSSRPAWQLTETESQPWRLR